MKKTIVAFVVVAACGTGGYFVNNLMIENVAQELIRSTERLAHDISDSYIDVQVIESKLIGDKVAQKFAIYLKNGAERHSQPVYLDHDATVALFGTKVEGQLGLPKDKGLSAEFIREVTSFNENIQYTLNPHNKSIDLQSSLNVGVINDGSRSQLKLGEINFNLVGSLEDNSSQFTISSIDFSERKESVHVGKVSLDTVVKPTLQSSIFTIDEGQLVVRKGGMNISDIQLKTEAVVSDKTSLHYNWTVGTFDLDSPDITLLSSKFGMQGSVEGLNTTTLMDLGTALESNNESRIEDLFKEILGDGIAFSNINLYLNDSSLGGHITLNKANYKTVESYEFDDLLQRSINSELDIVVTSELMDKFKVPSHARQKLWVKDENANYTTKFKTALGKVTINDIKVN
ncbi:TPA: hypothetical protein NKQ37_004492 [Vibrio parahaemolyticus]|nr:hypothetical protein [Vibrio parahaemolyticus]MDF4720709.1 hypothetical protein [Vibrio parahaemolyticus]HCE2428471.1 hypothetical protein [Vibrio parahaemolyticus]HCE2485908.1 hypothetical protein [Vibrio parahaemolyticus]HCE3564035.1 hypothetical protein [Vibrio parahaemolyticus]